MDMDAENIIKAAREQGWRIEEVKKGRMCYPPDRTQTPVLWHNTPSDVRAVRNFLAMMKRRGLRYPS